MNMNKKILITLFIKELYYNYLLSPLGFIFAALFILISGWLFSQDMFLINQASLAPFFSILPFLFMFFLPAITMNLFAEEKQKKTWEILLTLPTTEKDLVVSKFAAALCFSSLTLLLTLPFAIVLNVLGTPDWGMIASGYLGAFLLAGAYIATGIFFSSLTANPIIAFLGSIALLLVNFFLGQQNVLARLPDLARNIISSISLNFAFNSFVEGNLLLDNLILYFSWIFVFLFLTIVSLKSRDY